MLDPLIGGVLLCIAYQLFTQPEVPATAPGASPPVVKVKIEPVVKVKIEPAAKKHKAVDLVHCAAFPVPTEEEGEEVEEVEEEDAKSVKEPPKKKPRISCGAEERNPNTFKAVGVHTVRPGLEVYNPKGDGNCWFGAVVFGMFSINSPGVPFEKAGDEYQLALKLRVEIVQYMRENPKMYETVLVADGEERPFKTMDEYCDTMSKPGVQVDGSVMQAFCVLYKITISIYMRVDQKVQKISDQGESDENGTIKLYYTGSHYMCLFEF